MRELQHFEIKDPKLSKEQFKISVTDADEGTITISFQNPESNEIWTSDAFVPNNTESIKTALQPYFLDSFESEIVVTE